MGDRAQVVITENDELEGAVWLYSHWGGTDLPSVVQSALKRQERWNDSEYLARIVFQEMIGDDKSATGYGIGTSEHGDNEHPVLILNASSMIITARDMHHMPFKSFIELEPHTLMVWCGRENEDDE